MPQAVIAAKGSRNYRYCVLPKGWARRITAHFFCCYTFIESSLRPSRRLSLQTPPWCWYWRYCRAPMHFLLASACCDGACQASQYTQLRGTSIVSPCEFFLQFLSACFSWCTLARHMESYKRARCSDMWEEYYPLNAAVYFEILTQDQGFSWAQFVGQNNSRCFVKKNTLQKQRFVNSHRNFKTRFPDHEHFSS